MKEPKALTWSVEQLGDRLVGRPVGRVDEVTWEAFAAALIEAVGEARAAGAPLVVDLAGLNYMSSRGLRALTRASREAAGGTPIVLAAPSDTMREILAISRYDKMFKVVDSATAAL
jgi:anti-sigma B factor antagonist/stage II sporulation protein AA (anti-sigma F factor antagonist)